MADTVSKKNNDHFTKQAQLHRDVADHTRQMVSKHKIFHDNLIDAAKSSCMGDAIQNYTDWWNSFSTHLLNHADLHEQMAGHLDKTVNTFDDTDDNIKQSLNANDTSQSS